MATNDKINTNPSGSSHGEQLVAKRLTLQCRVSCFSCVRAGRPADVTAHLKCACYCAESAKNMHCRSKEHVAKFNSESEKTRAESSFYKHLANSHGGKAAHKNFSDYFEIQILKAYKKPFTRLVGREHLFRVIRGSCLTRRMSGTRPR